MSSTIETKEIEKQSESAITAAQDLTISSNDEYVRAGELRDSLKAIEKQIDNTFDHLIESAHKHHKSLVSEKKKHSEPIDIARGIIKKKLFAWEDEQERLRLAEEDRLRKEAQKKAEDDALAAAEAAGSKEEAQAILDAPVSAPTVVVPKSIPKVTGHTRRMVKKFRIVNEALIPRQYLTPDTVKIGGVVRSLGTVANIPGIEVYEEAA